MHRLNYNQLFYFYTIASEGSIKAASKKLHLTQPTISAQLKSLEESLGKPLFDREHRKLVLNSYGKEVLKRAEKIFIIGEEMISSLAQSSTNLRPDIRIGAVPSLPNSFLHKFTLDLWATENHSAHLIHGSLDDLINMLNEDRVDLILSDQPFLKSKRYKSINLGQQNLMAVGTKKFRGLKKNFPKSLSGQPYLGFQKTGSIQSDIDFFFKMNDIYPDIVGSVDDASFIRLVAERGVCVAILPEETVADSLRRRNLIKIGDVLDIQSNCWAIMSGLSSQKISTRKLISSFINRQKQLKKAKQASRKT